jgi:polysaccharide biosynthesis protein PelF
MYSTTPDYSMDKIIRDLESFSPVNIEEKRNLFVEIKSENDLLELAQKAKSADFKIKYFTIRHLSNFEYEGVIKSLADFLFDETHIIRNTAQHILANIKSEKKYDLLLKLIEPDKDLSIRLFAIKTLGVGEQFNSVLPLIELLQDEDPVVRCQATDALRIIRDPRSDDGVIKLLQDPEPSVRYTSAFYCGDLKVKKSSDYLAELLDDDNSKIRLASVWALGRIGYNRYSGKLLDLLSKEQNSDVIKQVFRTVCSEKTCTLTSVKESSGINGHKILQRSKNWVLIDNDQENKDESPEADICIIVEGSYPYISGGVSSWVHDLIRYFNDFKFAVVHIASTKHDIKEYKYELPENVAVYYETYLQDLPDNEKQPDKYSIKEKEKLFNHLFNFISNIKKQDRKSFEELFALLGIPGELKLNIKDLLFTEQSWEFQKRFYELSADALPFLEYSWSYRSIVVPVYNLLNSKLPPAKLYYPVLTGYAGLAGAAACFKTGKPLLLTEHGIYHRERMMEINKAGWIYETDQEHHMTQEVFTGLKKIWMEMYRVFSYSTYLFSDRITTLFDDNSIIQMESGAEKDRIEIIPNGIDLSRFFHIGDKDIGIKETFVIGLVGRVVVIKDIKTFIWAAKKVAEHLPGRVSFRVMGAYDEEVEYAEECFALVKMLEMEEYFEFTGKVDLTESFVELDLMVLTSVSEGQPLSLLESMAAGIPCVSTNVGACRELLYGRADEQPALGKSGLITSIYSPDETAEAIIKILNDPELYRHMSKSARKRVEQFYRREDIYKKYRALFETLIEKS